jgi:hypothetical protein
MNNKEDFLNNVVGGEFIDTEPANIGAHEVNMRVVDFLEDREDL